MYPLKYAAFKRVVVASGGCLLMFTVLAGCQSTIRPGGLDFEDDVVYFPTEPEFKLSHEGVGIRAAEAERMVEENENER